MTLAEAIELLRDHWSGDVRTDGRTVKVAVGGMTGDLMRAEWRYGDLVLVADRPDEPEKPAKTVVTDLRLFARGDQWGAVVELQDGTEVPVWAVNGHDPREVPPWEDDEKAYEDWYNRALEEAHRQGYWLEGEVDGCLDGLSLTPPPMVMKEFTIARSGQGG